jgi:peptide/nickel transport system permease protein
MSDTTITTDLDVTALEAPPADRRSHFGWRLVLRRFFRQKAAVFGLVVAFIIVMAGLLAPWIAPYDVDESTSDFLKAPSADHLLGTDQAGYDTLSRVMFATRTSIYAALLAVVLALVGGSLIGLVSGYLGRWVDTILMRLVDAIMAFPGLLMAMAVIAALGPGITNAMIGLSIAFMPGFARLVRAQVLAVKEEPYVEAARVVGAGAPRIVRRHVLPNIASTLIVQAFMAIGFALLAEGGLAFIGLSVQPPDTSLGSQMQRGFTLINVTLRLALIPGVVITLLSVSFNAIADGLRDAMARHEVSPELAVQA